MPESLAAKLRSLCVYRNLLKKNPVKAALDFFTCLDSPTPLPKALLSFYGEMFFHLRNEGFKDFGDLLRHETDRDENPFSLAFLKGTPDEALLAAAGHDFLALNQLAVLDSRTLKEHMKKKLDSDFDGTYENLPDWPAGKPLSLSETVRSYRDNGCGVFCDARAFIWENGSVIPILHTGALKQDEMIGYDRQRDAVLRNTRILLRGSAASNMLLYGDSGTGKSASVKSLLTRSDCWNLRIIEIPKATVGSLRPLLQMIAEKPQKFILFIDDITFDREDSLYAPLKSLLEGGLSSCPENTVVYATSNRRNIVKENFSEREGNDLHRSETMQEKISLADRFGLRVPFPSLTEAEFTNIVEFLARRAGLKIGGELLTKQAGKWALNRGRRTPRTARQLIEHISSISSSI